MPLEAAVLALDQVVQRWPFSVEALSAFRFQPPFFQSLGCGSRSNRRSARLNGVDGPLYWRDLQTGGAILPPNATPDDPVEFIADGQNRGQHLLDWPMANGA